MSTLCLLAFALPFLPCKAHAAERVTLRTGFDVNCLRRETLQTGQIRLILSGDGNYMDVAPDAITGSEPLAAMPSNPAPGKKGNTPEGSSTAESHVNTRALMRDAGARHNVDTALLASVVKAESAGNVRAVSRVGAQGLMQLMPGTAAKLGVSDAFSPEQNLNGGSAYLDQLLTRYHENLALALAAYNAGPAAVDRYHGIPPFRETRAYVAKVIREFNRQVLVEQHRAAAAALPVTK